jgi:hypothetical protein
VAFGKAKPKSVDPTLAATKMRRSPLLAVCGAALVVLGALLGLFLWNLNSTSVEVVGVAVSLDRGEVITSEHLQSLRITLDAGMDAVTADEMGEVVGQLAARDLTAGQVLTHAQVTADLPPAAGQRIVTVPVRADQYPLEPLRSGDLVTLTSPADNEKVIEAEVLHVEYADPTAKVDVIVGDADGVVLQRWATQDEVALSIKPRTGR